MIDGPLHGEPAALEVDVVQLVPVDEPAGGDVADLGVVLPAVPEPAQHLDVVGGLVEQVGDQPLRVRIVEAVGAVAGCSRRPKWAAASGAGARPGPGRRPGRCSRSRGWRWPWTGGTARCGW